MKYSKWFINTRKVKIEKNLDTFNSYRIKRLNERELLFFFLMQVT